MLYGPAPRYLCTPCTVFAMQRGYCCPPEPVTLTLLGHASACLHLLQNILQKTTCTCADYILPLHSIVCQDNEQPASNPVLW